MPYRKEISSWSLPMCLADGRRRHFDLYSKRSKDVDNKRLKRGEHSAGQEETEIKRCYGGEENEEKVDPSKDDKLPRIITQTPSSAIEKSSKSENDNVQVKAVTDNKKAEDTNRNVAHVKGNPLCNEKDSQNTNSHMEVTPQSVLSNPFNNLDESPSTDIRNEEDKLTTGVLNIYNVIAHLPEDNFLNHYVREQNMTNPQQQRKNLQKHVSDVLNSLRRSISTAEEGVDEKSLSNSLVSLYQKLHSKLTSQQLKKVMETIGMEGKPLMQDSNVLSKGGDSDLEGGRKVCKEKNLCGICHGSGTVIRDELQEKVAVDVLERNCEDTEVSFAEKYKVRQKISRQGFFVDSEDQEEEVLEEGDTKHPGNGTETSESILEEVVEETSCEDTEDFFDTADKAVDESMEKNIPKGSNKDGKEGSFGGVDDIHDAPLPEQEEDERSPFHKQSTFPGPSVHEFQLYQFWRKRYLQKKKMKRWNKAKKAGLGKPGGFKKHFRIDTDGPETSPDTCLESASQADEYRSEKLDVRAGYYRTRSCMNTEGGGGNSSLGGQSGSSGSSGSSLNRNRRGSGRRDSDDSNNSNNPDNNRRGHDRQPSDTSLPHPQHLLVEADIPGQDYKAVRKKHAEMTDEKLIDLLGSLSPDTSPGMQGDPGLLKDVNHCMLIVLHELSNQDDIYCSVCNVLHYLFNHFARCQLLYKKCNICWQVHRLSLYHVQCCLQAKKTARESSSDICQQLLESVTFNVELVQSRSEQLFLKMKKYVDKVLHPYGLHGSGSLGMYSMSEKGDGFSMGSDHSPSATLTLEDSMPSGSSVKGPQVPVVPSVTASSFGGQFSRTGSGRIYQPSLKRIPESPLRDVSSLKVNLKPRGRRPVSRQLSNEAHSGASRSAENSLVGSKSDDGPSMDSVRHARKTDLLQGSIGELAGESYQSLPTVPTEGGSSRSSWGPVDDSSLATSVSSGHDEGPTAEDVIYDRYKPMMDTQGNIFQPETRAYSTEGEVDKIYGVTGAMSLPIGSTFQGEQDQNISLTMAPTGEPGIGEVVYGTRRQLKKVARFWANIRRQLDHESYKYQMREEGVILESAKKHLRILRTRYQKKNQWMRLVHLGNGVAGKCHLARDSTTGFSFCVKRVHIAKYEENELVIWCDLDHTNIVKLYGAIRHGPKIYIFCEFVDGGSLTSLINEQRSLNRRLSHWMCLRYFKQLLQVLLYLEARNVLHEDLKADNILVKRNTTLIAVTDFGLGKYLNVDSEMKGMSPTGSQTQWSPEKATSIGHGFAADVWAAVCILVHMLSGHPPWTQRFPGAQMLHFVIFMQSPPLDDIPANVQEVVRDLITQGFTVDPKLRPSAAKLMKHPAFKVLEQGAPTSYYSTLKSTGQPLPDNQLGPTEASGPQELEEILSSMSAGSKVAPHGARQPSLSERRLPSVQFRVSGEGSSGSDLASSLAKHNEGSLPSSSSQPQDENDGPRLVAPMAGAASVVPIAGVGSTDRHSTSTAEAPGAQEHHSEEGNEASSEEHPQELTKLPTFLRSSFYDIPDGVPGDTLSFSQLSFEDTDKHIHSFLRDVVPVVEFLPSSQALPEYRRPQRILLSLDNMPRLSLLVDNNQLTYNGITLDEQNTLPAQLEMKSEKEALPECGDEAAPSAARLTPLPVLQSTPNTSQIEIRVTPSPLDDPGPTSFYPPTGFYEEHIDSSDLFGDGSEEAKAVDDEVVKLETINNKQDSSLETMDDRSDCGAGTEEIFEGPNFDFSGRTANASPQSERKSKSVTSFFRGAPDYAVETSKTKDCPIESESIDIPGAENGSQPYEDVSHARKQEGGRSLEKKNPGLTIDITCNKKLAYKRNQSTPAESKPRSPPSVKHPKTDPMVNNAGTGRGKKVEGSSGLGASLPCQVQSEPRINSSRSSDTSGVFLLEKGQLSSTEFSPKSVFDHQEQEFSALGKASQSDLSGQEDQAMMAMVDNPDQDIPFTLDPEHESFENQLLSVQKNLKTESDVSEFGAKLHLIRENGESVKQMLVPRHYEDWGKLTDTIRQAVKDYLGYDHYTLKDSDGSPVNYNSTPYKQDRKVMVCCLEAGETNEGCWCDQHDYQLMHFA